MHGGTQLTPRSSISCMRAGEEIREVTVGGILRCADTQFIAFSISMKSDGFASARRFESVGSTDTLQDHQIGLYSHSQPQEPEQRSE